MSVLIEKSEQFELAYGFVTETNEHIFLTGKAGTGKTTFLKYLKEHCTKNILVAAPTGVAAINAGGVTLHSLFQLPFHPFLPTKNNKTQLVASLKYNKQRQQLLRKIDLLVIDEISMVRCDVIDAIDTVLRSIRRQYDTPFGGVQLLFIGDLYQLPPVAQQHEWNMLQEHYASPYFFDSYAIKEQMPLLIELDVIYRQKAGSFVKLLNKIRNNEMMEDDYEDLHLRYDPSFRPDPGEQYITLCSHNKQADRINQQQLARLLSPVFAYKARIEDDFPENMFPADETLQLKTGAQVMFLKNDLVRKRYFNGKLAIVKYVADDKIIVDCDGEDIEVVQESWENARYHIHAADGKMEQEVIGSFIQYPLRLAWAITIHKSQGLTFDKLLIDAGAAFSSGQVYVALSRCTSLEGIVLLSKIPPTAITSNESVLKAEQSLIHKGSLAERFEGAREVFTQQLLEEIFSFAAISISLGLLEGLIHQHREKLQSNAVQWMSDYKMEVSADILFGIKFTNQVSGLMKAERRIENNDALQQRIKDAAQYFEKRFQRYQQELQRHPIVTEYKEVSAVLNEQLGILMEDLVATNYLLAYCKESFSVTGFLLHKLKFIQPKISISSYAGNKKQTNSNIPNPELFDTLKRWRDQACEENNMPIYMVANQATLTEISTYLPLNKSDLLKISGFGKAKVQKFGEDILDAVTAYCAENQLETNMGKLKTKGGKTKDISTPAPKKRDTKLITYTLFKEGKTIAQIAEERKLVTNTIESHLVPYIEDQSLNINELLTVQKQTAIRNAIVIHGKENLSVLMENLPKNISYGQIKMLIASEKNNEH